MITNERQARITRAQIKRLDRALAQGQAEPSDLDLRLRKAALDSQRSLRDDLQEQLDLYEMLKNEETVAIEMGSLSDLPVILVQARIAQGLTQADLAERLNLKEQQIQRYEATRYQTASFKRIVEIASVLGVDLQDTVEIVK
jgi:ribosome-binding protein aMBF1 (putative translation factor)